MNKLLVIAGSGVYPRLLIEGAKRAGVKRVEVLAIKGSTERETIASAHASHIISIGSIASAIAWAGEQKFDGAILAGQVSPLSLFRGRFEPKVRAWLDELKVKNAHTIFTLVAEKFAEVNVPLLPASFFMEDHIPGEGVITKRDLTENERTDVLHAMHVMQAVGEYDVGQTVVVKAGMVLAVEAFEGTNAAIRRGGKLGGKGSVIFKGARANHDMRFDIPVVGLTTLKKMHRAGASAIAFHASRLILVDKEKVINYANRHNIAIVGLATSLPRAPIRP